MDIEQSITISCRSNRFAAVAYAPLNDSLFKKSYRFAMCMDETLFSSNRVQNPEQKITPISCIADDGFNGPQDAAIVAQARAAEVRCCSSPLHAAVNP